MEKPDYKNIVYICHPYGGLLENEAEVKELLDMLTMEYPKWLFVSGVNSFGYAYFDTDFDRSMDMCYWLLDKCDEMWVYGDWESSRGCKAEIEYCKEALIPIKYKEV